MKKRILLTLALVVSLTFGYTIYASACHIEEASITANCVADGVGGYSIDSIVLASTYPIEAEVTYELTITGPSGTYSENRPFTADTIPFEVSMQVEDCGAYSITGSVTWSDHDTQVLDPITVECICNLYDGCPRTPGYWKNHLDTWLVDTLIIAGETKTQDELIEMLTQPVRGDIDVILIKHLIAAKLNIGFSIAPICETINAADDYLSSGGDDRSIAEPLKDALDTFNNGGDCD